MVILAALVAIAGLAIVAVIGGNQKDMNQKSREETK